MAQFDWEDFFLETEGFFTGFADFLATRYDFVLIDSRTGMTDISSICTMVLPSKLVVVFTPNTQSLTGIEELIRKAVHYRLKSADERPLQVFPLPSRIPIDRPRLYQTWRYGGTTESSTVAIRGYQRVFEAVFAEVYDFTSLQNQFEDYFNQAQLQQISDYAYGEPIAVELEKDESRLSIRASYEAFLELLLELDGP